RELVFLLGAQASLNRRFLLFGSRRQYFPIIGEQLLQACNDFVSLFLLFFLWSKRETHVLELDADAECETIEESFPGVDSSNLERKPYFHSAEAKIAGESLGKCEPLFCCSHEIDSETH